MKVEDKAYLLGVTGLLIPTIAVNHFTHGAAPAIVLLGILIAGISGFLVASLTDVYVNGCEVEEENTDAVEEG